MVCVIHNYEWCILGKLRWILRRFVAEVRCNFHVIESISRRYHFLVYTLSNEVASQVPE